MAKKSARSPSFQQNRKKNKLNPREIFQNAIEKFQTGALKDARSDFRKLLKNFPDVADAYYFLSLIASQEREYKEAQKQIKHALDRNPSNPAYICQMANIHRLQGDHSTAVKHYRRALELDDRMLEALINLGMSLRGLADLDAAIEVYKSALDVQENIPETHNNLGTVYLLKNETDLAMKCFERAIEINPDFAGGHNNLARACLRTGRMDRALLAFRTAVYLQPNYNIFLSDLADCLGQVRLDQPDVQLEKDMARCLKLDRVDGGTLGQAVALYLLDHSSLGELVKRLQTSKEETDFTHEEIQSLSSELLLVYMEREQVCNPDLELLLTRLRCFLLREISRNAFIKTEEKLHLMIVLSRQCFNNEYVFDESKGEIELLNKLNQKLCKETAMGNIDIPELMIYSCYRPLLSNCELAQNLKDIKIRDDRLQQILRKQITEPEREIKLRSRITSISETNNKVSGQVRRQYEENPYPRWFHADYPQLTSLFEYVVNLFPSVADFMVRDRTELSVLVAGCGTGLQTVRNARRFKDASVTGVDLSLTSLAYAVRMTQQLGLNNVRYLQGDILDLDRLTDKFDFIESFGVLHHMQDPLKGWQCLAKKLKPGGCMRIGLYSYKARAAIRAARDFIEGENYTSNAEDIRACRKEILALKPEHPAWKLRNSPDFYTMSECRDLIFHVHEQQLDIPFIKQAIEDMELRFLGFEFPDSVAISDFKKQYPETGSEINLDLWDEYEIKNPDTFVSQYVIWVVSE